MKTTIIYTQKFLQNQKSVWVLFILLFATFTLVTIYLMKNEEPIFTRNTTDSKFRSTYNTNLCSCDICKHSQTFASK